MLGRSIRNVDYDVLADEMFALRRSGQICLCDWSVRERMARDPPAGLAVIGFALL